MVIDHSVALCRLFQLVSPSLPVGAYSFSQGLEWAVEDRLVHDALSAEKWILTIIEQSLAKVDAPIIARMYDSWVDKDLGKLDYWDNYLYASRETKELRDEDRALGFALGKLLDSLGLPWSEQNGEAPCCYAKPFSFAGYSWGIPKSLVVSGYLWAWLDNQVLAAIKLVPLGQSAGQRILYRLAERISAQLTRALLIEDHEIGGTLPMLAIASSRHETQYTRLFRS